MANPPSYTGGVKPMAIAGRVSRERERLMGMSDAERAWRAQWLKDQVLAHDEPIVPENWYRERYNPIRRFYRAPLDVVENSLKRRMNATAAEVIRHVIGKTTIFAVGVLCIWYHFKYNAGDWTKKSAWKVTTTRAAVYPRDREFPNYPKPEDDDYAAFGFKQSPI